MDWTVEDKFMNEQTNQLIRELAEKLGTTSEYLWQALIRQAPIEAWTHLLICGFLIMLAVSALRWIRNETEEIGEWQVGVVIAFSVIGFIAVLFLIMESRMIVAGLFNPEYWALKQILK